MFQGAIRVTLEMVLEEEVKAMVGARRFERVGSRKDHRNGTHLRRLLTSLGQIDVMVPCSREGGSPADEHAGRAAALRRFLPEVRRQRCTVHLQRNVLAKVPHRLHTEIKRRIRSVGAFPDRASALRLITAVALKTTAVWSERRYLDLSLLEPKEVAKAA